MASEGKNVLICGHRSFAAKGLSALLNQAGYSVTQFSRGAVSVNGNTVEGAVDEIHTNPHLANSFDTVINYVLLKDNSVQDNERYLESLLKLCEEKQVKHLIHISSISVYKSNAKLINEEAAVETNPNRKGSYGALKVAQDEYIKANMPHAVKLSLVRPGFILGKGLVDPIVGTGLRAPWNNLLIIGNAQSQLPLISRKLVNQAIVKLVSDPPTKTSDVLVLADTNSPTRKEYLNACNSLLGCGTGSLTLPVIFWLIAGAGGEIVLYLLGKKKMKPLQKIIAACQKQTFDSTLTETRLGMKFTTDWRKALCDSMDSQKLNFDLPYIPCKLCNCTGIEKITFLGCGRIVHQKHLSALKRVNYSGDIDVYDLIAPTKRMPENIRIINKNEIDSSDIFVVATPGPAHIQALEILKPKAGKILLEKPLCYSQSELKQWQHLNSEQPSRIFVCHNYRFKQNVQGMLAHLLKYNPGKLLNASVLFQSPPVSNDSATWLRAERKAYTLLIDYAIHFLDLACMFGRGAWNIDNVRHELNIMGQTSLIDGCVSCDNYSVNFLLRQGFMPRKANIVFAFQNYSVSLRFFPDTFVSYMTNDNAWLYKKEASELRKSMYKKIFDKLLDKDSDLSHSYAYLAVSEGDEKMLEAISFNHLASFYDLMFKLTDSVYGS